MAKLKKKSLRFVSLGCRLVCWIGAVELNGCRHTPFGSVDHPNVVVVAHETGYSSGIGILAKLSYFQLDAHGHDFEALRTLVHIRTVVRVGTCADERTGYAFVVLELNGAFLGFPVVVVASSPFPVLVQAFQIGAFAAIVVGLLTVATERGATGAFGASLLLLGVCHDFRLWWWWWSIHARNVISRAVKNTA